VLIRGPHGDTITDVAWQANKRLLITSLDGFVSTYTFGVGELGRILSLGEHQPSDISSGAQRSVMTSVGKVFVDDASKTYLKDNKNKKKLMIDPNVNMEVNDVEN
jgi:hypothetical protein